MSCFMVSDLCLLSLLRSDCPNTQGKYGKIDNLIRKLSWSKGGRISGLQEENLTHSCQAALKRDFCKQCRPRSSAPSDQGQLCLHKRYV